MYPTTAAFSVPIVLQRESLKKFTRIITALTKTAINTAKWDGHGHDCPIYMWRGGGQDCIKDSFGDHMFLTANLQKHSYSPALSKRASARKEGQKEGVM
jgi:hypothetical protein